MLAGGTSCEREISLISGRAVFDALKIRGLDVSLLDPAKGDFIAPLKNGGVSIVFIALHGSFGEDGTVQKMLDEAGIAYTGSSAAASARSFDKSIAQTIFKKIGLLVPESFALKKSDPLPKARSLKYPLVVKPAACGSSIGISILKRAEEFAEACRTAFMYSDVILIEQFIRGREVTVGVLGEEALPPVEVITPREFYDTQAKYKDSGTQYECPARLTLKETAELSKAALTAYHALGCEVMARVDFILGENSAPYILESNTIPGLTGKSLLPKAAKASGVEFPDLCVKILQLSVNRQGVRK